MAVSKAASYPIKWIQIRLLFKYLNLKLSKTGFKVPPFYHYVCNKRSVRIPSNAEMLATAYLAVQGQQFFSHKRLKIICLMQMRCTNPDWNLSKMRRGFVVRFMFMKIADKYFVRPILITIKIQYVTFGYTIQRKTAR